MNLNIMFIVFIIGTIIIDFLTYKTDEEKELSHKKSKRVIKNFISNSFTYILFTLVISLLIKYILGPEDYVICHDNCTITITNSLIGAIILGLQILSIYSFYDNYIYSYRFLTSNFKTLEKILIAILGISFILINEFILSNVNLNILTFNIDILDLLIKVVIYSTYIFIPVLIIIREIFNISRRKEEY